MAGRMINGAAALAELVRPASDTDEIGVHRVLPVLPELSGLLPGRGLRRGSTVAIATGRTAPAGGGTSLLLALLAAASQSGSWCAVVGVPALGALAAAESGIALDRLALIPNPGPDWPTVVAALIDGVDLVVTAVPGQISSSIAGRLAARARQRGSVLVPFGSWAGADLTLQVTQGRWEGLGQGHGRLRRRRVTVLAQGRGAAARPRELTMWMPGVTTPPVPPPGVPGPPVPSRGVPGPPVPSRGVPGGPVSSRGVPGPLVSSRGVPGALVSSRRVPGPPDSASADAVLAAPLVAVPTFAVAAASLAASPFAAAPSPSAPVLFAVPADHSFARPMPRAVRRGDSFSRRWILWRSGCGGAVIRQDRVVGVVRGGDSFSRRWILWRLGCGGAVIRQDRVVGVVRGGDSFSRRWILWRLGCGGAVIRQDRVVGVVRGGDSFSRCWILWRSGRGDAVTLQDRVGGGGLSRLDRCELVAV